MTIRIDHLYTNFNLPLVCYFISNYPVFVTSLLWLVLIFLINGNLPIHTENVYIVLISLFAFYETIHLHEHPESNDKRT